MMPRMRYEVEKKEKAIGYEVESLDELGSRLRRREVRRGD